MLVSLPRIALVRSQQRIGRRAKPPLHSIPVSRPFQLLGIDLMDLPLTEKGNRHIVVVQGLFTNWPIVFAVPEHYSHNQVDSRGSDPSFWCP